MQNALNYVDSGLAKRLAEAADTFRDGTYRYFVCQSEFPYDLHYTAGYDNAGAASEEASSIQADKGSSYYVFGPYKTENADNEPDPDYDAIKLTFLQNSVEKDILTLPSDIDAIVLSVSAYDKFFQPYYLRLYGMVRAQEIRSNAVLALTSTPKKPVPHSGKTALGSGTGGTKLTAGSYQAG